MSDQEYNPNMNCDFNLQTDKKEVPLVPDGTYRGNVTTVRHDPKHNRIIFTVALDGNGGNCSDNETPIDGTQHDFSTWLPKPGDENERTASGKMTKRQSKINALANFVERFNLKVVTLPDILSKVQNSEWVGMECQLEITSQEWNDTWINNANRMNPVG